MRIIKSKSIPDKTNLLKHLLDWAKPDSTSCLLTSNGHTDPYGKFDILLGVGAKTSIHIKSNHAFSELSKYRAQVQDWLLGFMTYDLKNEVENLQSANLDGLDFPDLYFFQPLKLIRIIGNTIEFLYLPEIAADIEKDFELIFNSSEEKIVVENYTTPKVKVRFNKDAYCDQVDKMLDHIHRGDIYEANFCQEFYAESKIDPLKSFLHLNEISKAPFAAFLKIGPKYALCSSPERYLCKRNTKLISQPIKGTARRSNNTIEDLKLARELAQDPKERSENIMITDLVRNDLSKLALKGSVQVEELCKVYSFKQVHQMISTITASVEPDTDPISCIKNTYPMGSMTGAPKLSAMQIIEDLENSKRGLYSGSIGYFEPNGDFDFNVVIRSLLYDAEKPYVSFTVGSAITAQAIPEKEYEECLLKAKAMRETLEA
ncbi:anthranilate synthase component I family protein [Leeuwenhoekiella sp. W20_SRS_FM14]|uniref:anthranilate synthase component I family protein n=1 Tax=Leeuwenhoekiella sp. W20_SRS_FM14 TaxID=3240270 RepID=UPI003F974ED4